MDDSKLFDESDHDEVRDEEVDAIFSPPEKSKKKKSSSKKQPKASTGGGGGDDNDDDDDGIERDAKEAKKRIRKAERKSSTKKRARASSLFLDEAAEADDSDEDEEEHGEVGEQELTAEEKQAQQRVEERHQRQRQDTRTVEEMALHYEQLDKEQRKHDKLTLEAARSARGHKFIQPATLPDYSDPKIYKIRCKIGQELLLIRSILLKSFDLQRHQQGAFKIKSAFCGNSGGHIYVEAFADTFVKEVISSLHTIYGSTLQQIPIQEMTQVLEVAALNKPLSRLQFVRMRRGVNKGDLARVLEIFDGGEKVMVQIVPRLEYLSEDVRKHHHHQQQQGGGGGQAVLQNQQHKMRPVQRLFDAEAARAVSEHEYLRRATHPDNPDFTCDVWGNDYFKDGFLIKTVRTDIWVNGVDVKPSLDELKLFESTMQHDHNDQNDFDNEYDEDGHPTAASSSSSGNRISQQELDNALLEQIAKIESAKVAASPFVPGDLVQVTEGDLALLVARVLSVDDKACTARVLPVSEVFKGAIDVELALLAKHILPGAHVKVMAGQFAGQTGQVLNVSSGGKDAIAVILSDGIKVEFHCNVSFLQVRVLLGLSSSI
jgi:transcription elongation factor SPT5